MAKRKRKESLGVSFFSFLDIMTATMGTLILILICITLISIKMDKKNIHIKLKADETDDLVKQPVFIECAKDALIIHPQLFEIKQNNLRNKQAYFMKLLYNLDRNRHYIIFAIRPNGYEVFKKARAITESMDIGVGFEPIDRYWQLKLDRNDLPAPIPD